MSKINELMSRKLDDVLNESWKIRNENFPLILTVSAPSAKTYISDHYRNKRASFVNISVTGGECALECEHCKKRLLETMISVKNSEELNKLGDRLVEKGCEGVLISGGSLPSGEVPLMPYIDGIAYLKSRGLKVIVHTGLATRETAKKLKMAGVDQVLLDIIGDDTTIRSVYHLDKTTADFQDALSILTEEGLDIAPHIVIGLDFGRIVGEYRALEMICEVKPNTVVLVILSPPPEEIGKIAAIARILNPDAHITLGCARPIGDDREVIEKYAVMAGLNGIAYPSDETIEHAESLGLKVMFKDTCCSLL